MLIATHNIDCLRDFGAAQEDIVVRILSNNYWPIGDVKESGKVERVCDEFVHGQPKLP